MNSNEKNDFTPDPNLPITEILIIVFCFIIKN